MASYIFGLVDSMNESNPLARQRGAQSQLAHFPSPHVSTTLSLWNSLRNLPRIFRQSPSLFNSHPDSQSAEMCTIIVTIRSVLWYVMSLAGTLMILVALFTNRWLDGTFTATNLGSVRNLEKTALDVFDSVSNNQVSLTMLPGTRALKLFGCFPFPTVKVTTCGKL